MCDSVMVCKQILYGCIGWVIRENSTLKWIPLRNVRTFRPARITLKASSNEITECGYLNFTSCAGLSWCSPKSKFILPPMSAKNFIVETLVFSGVYPRGHPRCTQSPNDRLEVVVNKYQPRNNPKPTTVDVSLILLHANGFHKVIDFKGGCL